MAAEHSLKSKNPNVRATSATSNNSMTSSTTSSSRKLHEPSVESLSSPASSSARSKPQQYYSESSSLDAERAKENVTVTVRFRPLSPREIRQGEEIAWYADGDTIVRNENDQSIAYAYDGVFGPTTTTRHVYDYVAQHVISGAMEGINGTIFAYGVTSSGKTHTMHGDQRSPGIIPLAVKDAFSIIQETPNREFLLRVSYLEIYNEVVNDLLNPAGQNLRIREDAQGTFVEGIKEEIVLSPAHALSLVAAGEEHRHVGSTMFNLLSSRSHTIFTLTIESSPCGENCEGEAVSLSQLNLIDLAGSESSSIDASGVRRKEGSYINRSLLTLGTVISKLTDGKSTHIPYRDSKLTRFLQSSLSGHGRVSLICTVTPSSSNSEETHNTLKFAHRAKHIEIQAVQNKIIDEKSLIKKYQSEIQCLKEELEQLKLGIATVRQKDKGDDILYLKQKIEEGQVRKETRLEQEEEAKGALMSRIQRLKKLILVSTKSSQSPRFPHHPGPRRKHSFGEDELAYLPHRRRDLVLDDESMDIYVSHDANIENADDPLKGEKRTKKNGLLNWLKMRKRDSGTGTLASSSDKSSEARSISIPSTPQADSTDIHVEARHSHSLRAENTAATQLSNSRHNNDAFEPDSYYSGQVAPLHISARATDRMDLLREQHKIMSGDVPKQLSAEAAKDPKEHIQVGVKNLKDEIQKKNYQIASSDKQITNSIIHGDEKRLEDSQNITDLMAQFDEKSFELEVKSADNRIIQEHLNQKIAECEELQCIIASLRQQLSVSFEPTDFIPWTRHSQSFSETGSMMNMEMQMGKENTGLKDPKDALLLQSQASELEELRKKMDDLTDSKNELELHNKKLAEESLYAKGLASAAAVELKVLSEEVTKLMKHNERLTAELEVQNKPVQRRSSISSSRNSRKDSHSKQQGGLPTSDIRRELALSRERELSYEAALAEKVERESELLSVIEESKQKEIYLENELANMWILTAKLKKSQGLDGDDVDAESQKNNFDIHDNRAFQ